MPKLLQINITANWGSHGRIAEGIAQLAISQGWESHIAYGRWANDSQSHLFRIGSMTDEYLHVAAVVNGLVHVAYRRPFYQYCLSTHNLCARQRGSLCYYTDPYQNSLSCPALAGRLHFAPLAHFLTLFFNVLAFLPDMLCSFFLSFAIVSFGFVFCFFFFVVYIWFDIFLDLCW